MLKYIACKNTLLEELAHELSCLYEKIIVHRDLNRSESIRADLSLCLSLTKYQELAKNSENNLRQTLDVHNRLVRTGNSLVRVEQILSRLLLVDGLLGERDSSKNTITRAHHFRPVERECKLVGAIDSISFCCTKFHRIALLHRGYR